MNKVMHPTIKQLQLLRSAHAYLIMAAREVRLAGIREAAEYSDLENSIAVAVECAEVAVNEARSKYWINRSNHE